MTHSCSEDDTGWGESTVISCPKQLEVDYDNGFSSWSRNSTNNSLLGINKEYNHQNDIRGRTSRGRGYNQTRKFEPQRLVPVETWEFSNNDDSNNDIKEWGGPSVFSTGPAPGSEASLDGDTMTINVPQDLVGKIIGRQGATIKGFQKKSGARISLGRNTTKGEIQVLITGATEQRENASRLIEKCTGRTYGVLYASGLEAEKEPRQTKIEFEEFDWGKAIAQSVQYTREKWVACPDIVKEFYFESPEVANMTPEEVAQFRKDNNNIVVRHFDQNDTRQFPNPCVTFNQVFKKYPDILSEIEKNGFEKPSPIQAQSWPVLLKGIDLIGISQTGTGKTLAYLLPAMIHIEGQTTPREKRVGPTALILVPTRELAQQIEREAQKYSYRGIRTLCIYGKGDMKKQMDAIARGVEIVIATPGRLCDFCLRKCINLMSVSYLVLDEADRMLEDGFEPDIKKLFIDIRPDRQTVMMSATWPAAVRSLADNYMKSPLQIYVNTLDLTACHSVNQQIVFLEFEEKQHFLENFIRNMEPNDKVIVFVGRKIICDEIGSDLALKGIKAQLMHGDRDQEDREQALEDLKSGDVRVLVATDVASRGLDIDDITHILNLDFPRNIEEYVHRIGRTGRAGRIGTSVTIMSREDWKHAEELIKIMEEASQEVPQELRDMAKRYSTMLERRKVEKEAYGITGRRGGFGGGRRRDSGNVCYNCGEGNHISRDCPTRESVRGTRGGSGFGGRRGGRW